MSAPESFFLFFEFPMVIHLPAGSSGACCQSDYIRQTASNGQIDLIIRTDRGSPPT